MPESKNEPPRRRYSADSWVKLILIGSRAFALVTFNMAILIRAVVRENIDSTIMASIFDSYLALFGVVVGYVLGSRKD